MNKIGQHASAILNSENHVVKISIKVHNSVTNLCKPTGKILSKILRNINTYVKLGEIPSICSHDIEWKRNSDRHHSRAISYKLEKTDRQQSQHMQNFAKFCACIM